MYLLKKKLLLIALNYCCGAGVGEFPSEKLLWMLSRMHTLAFRADLQKQRLLDSTGPAATPVDARAHHKCLLAK